MLLKNVASCVLANLIFQVQPVLDRFRDYKRSAALLAFDDLIFAARGLLGDHDDVRRALGARFSRVRCDRGWSKRMVTGCGLGNGSGASGAIRLIGTAVEGDAVREVALILSGRKSASRI